MSSGILEDVLKQNGIPFLTKNVLGAGLAIKVGPMLDRRRFFVPYSCLEDATAITDELFSGSGEEAGPQEE